ncbi:MAG: TerB family tellurite resistance protein, partial [Candidatus Omnitrophota bacterium]
EISDNLPYKFKLSIIKDLFRVAFSDNQLDDRELETIRKISGLLHVSHRDFVEAKIEVKKEVGLET